MQQYKECKVCGEEKPLDEFNWQSKGKLNRKYLCKECQKEYDKKYYKQNRKKKIERVKERRRANKNQD